MRALGLSTVGDLLEHLPARQPRGAHGRRRCAPASRRRSPCRCARSARARSAGAACARSSRRPSPTRPAACARPSSTSRGSSSATRRARACCCTARPTRAAAFASPTMRLPQAQASLGSEAGSVDGAPAREDVPRPASGAVAHYPASEGVSSTQILTLVQQAREHLLRRRRAAPRPHARRRAAARPRERAGGDALPARRRGQRAPGASAWPSRSCC